ncbi:MAG: hypothetical protein ABFE07_11210 [Armatimonadia bacterium]
MHDTIADRESIAAWTVAGAMAAGLDLWVQGEVLYRHGPEDARARWETSIKAIYMPIKVYLAREVFPCR